jgi:hypothetical protein
MVIGPCACGSADLFAIKPGALAEYGPPLDERGWPDLAATPVLKVAEIPDVFTCRACFLKTMKETHMTDRLVIEITGDLPEAGKYAILADCEAQMKMLVSGLMETHSLALKVSVKAVRPTKKPGASNGATTVLPGAVDLAPRVGKTLAENV